MDNESTTIIKLENVWEEQAAEKLAMTILHQIINPTTAETRGLGQIHQIFVDIENAVVSSDAFDTSIDGGNSHHAMGSTYADEILFSIEERAEEILQQMNGS